jgi:predicted nucleotidyltransferase
MNKIWEVKFGSHLYGTNTENSDLDFKAIYLPTAREIVLGNYKKTVSKSRPKADCERNNKDDIDIEIFSLDRYLELLIEGQTVALDMLFAPYENVTHMSTFMSTDLMATIRCYRNKLLTKNVNAFVGYSRQQAAKYGIKGSRMDALKQVIALLELFYYQDKLLNYTIELENLVLKSKELISLEKTPLIEIVMLKGSKGLMDSPHLRVNGRSIPFHASVKYAKEIISKMLDGYGQRAHKAHLEGGVDWKALSHAVRVSSEAVELLSTGHITFPRPDRELLLKVKLGQLPYEQVAEMIEQGLADLYTANEKSTLRDKPDQEWVDNFVYDVYSQIVKNS